MFFELLQKQIEKDEKASDRRAKTSFVLRMGKQTVFMCVRLQLKQAPF